ncbi:MAG TPA: peroxide stress protein YaaA [Candidatus Limnocylindrales bacterium]|jgi:hypothetical protein
MLILVPPSESKRPPPEDGPAVALDALSFPELTPLRSRILDALIETSAGADAFQRLFERPTMAGLIERNTRLRELATRAASDVYVGELHDGLAVASLSAEGTERAGESLIITSALWGALRPADRIPPYRMRVWSNLVGLGRVEPMWRAALPDLFAERAGPDALVVDLRTPPFQSLGMPTGLSDRTVRLRVDQYSEGGRRVGDVIAKRIRGEAAHLLLESDVDPDQPDAIADLLGERWPVRLEPPERKGRSWTLSLTPDEE